jgi:hypothetical protein
MSLLELDGIDVPFSTASLIILHSLADSQTFSLVVRDSGVCPSARWFAPLLIFARFNTGLLFLSNSYELSPMIA